MSTTVADKINAQIDAKLQQTMVIFATYILINITDRSRFYLGTIEDIATTV